MTTNHTTQITLQGSFLLAMPQLTDPYFVQSVVYLYQHDSGGSMGFIINKPTSVTVKDIAERLQFRPKDSLSRMPALLGGPVAQDQLFLLTAGAIDSSSENTATAVSKNIVQKIINEETDQQVVFFLGYCAWQSGQLESEITDNHWVLAPYHRDLLFKESYENRYRTAAMAIGITDRGFLSAQVGHA